MFVATTAMVRTKELCMGRRKRMVTQTDSEDNGKGKDVKGRGRMPKIFRQLKYKLMQLVHNKPQAYVRRPLR